MTFPFHMARYCVYLYSYFLSLLRCRKQMPFYSLHLIGCLMFNAVLSVTLVVGLDFAVPASRRHVGVGLITSSSGVTTTHLYSSLHFLQHIYSPSFNYSPKYMNIIQPFTRYSSSSLPPTALGNVKRVSNEYLTSLLEPPRSSSSNRHPLLKNSIHEFVFKGLQSDHTP